MKGAFGLLKVSLLALVMMTLHSPLIYGKEKEKPPLEKTYQAKSVDQVYAAMVRAAGATMTNSVKEACVVNMRWSDVVGSFYTIVNVSASCQDLNGGNFSISLSPQVNTNRIRIGDFKDKNLALFWLSLDRQLTTPASDASQPK